MIYLLTLYAPQIKDVIDVYNCQRHNIEQVPRWGPIMIFIGASLSEPHTSESNSALVSILLSLWYVRLTEYVYKLLFLRIRIT